MKYSINFPLISPITQIHWNMVIANGRDYMAIRLGSISTAQRETKDGHSWVDTDRWSWDEEEDDDDEKQGAVGGAEKGAADGAEEDDWDDWD